MNILYVLNSGNPGGLEQYTLDLIKGSVVVGNTVFVWCKEGAIVDWYKNAGAVVTTKAITLDVDPAYILSLSRFIKENNIDIVHTGELKASVNGVLATVLAKQAGVVTHIHTPMSEWRINGIFKRIFTKIESFFYSVMVNLFADYEIALTESRKQIKIKEGIKSSKLVVIPNGFDLTRLDMSEQERAGYRSQLISQYDLPTDAIVLGNVSRLTEEKGHEYLIKAFKILLSDPSVDTSNYYLFFAGGGKLEEKLKSLARDLDIYDRVRISGIFSSQDWKKYYSLFDLYVFPSLAEGFGYVLVEGMYLGIPVICSAIPVLKEVGDTTVTYFKTADPISLYNKLKETILNQNGIWQRSDTLAKQRVVAEFSMSKFTNAYLNLYKQIVERKK